MTTFTLEPVTLRGGVVRLEPVTLERIPGIRAAAPDETWTGLPIEIGSEGLVAGPIEMAEARASAGQRLSFVTSVRSSDEIAGGTSCLNVDPSR